MTSTTEAIPPVGTKHLEALQRRHQSYAIHFVLGCGMDGYPPANADPADENLALGLRNCARQPRPDEYPAIRMHVDTYRMAQMSTADAVRDRLRELAQSHESKAGEFADMADMPNGDSRWYVAMYRDVAGELRKVADSL